MTYQHQHLLNWLNTHPCINISEVERLAMMPKGTLRHFVKDRRDITNNNFIHVEKILIHYGYQSLSNE